VFPSAVGLGRDELSVEDPEAVRRTVAEIRPDVVFNCAADNAVDGAEREPDRAFAVNGAGPGHLALACREVGARLVHFSTNYVFDGEAAEPYSEEDEPRPQSTYARSKLEGERRVLDVLPTALVIRASGLFGLQGSAVKGGSFPERILAKARAGEPLAVIHDQRLNPTFTRDLAAGTLDLVEAGTEGVVHLVAADCCSWWELAGETVRLAGLDAEVRQLTSDAFPAAASRPRNGCLRSVRAPFLRSWREGLAAYVAELPARP
jgi:dTDP-4-dehydrorhamnose reductase